MKIRVGSRESKLAVVQAQLVIDAIRRGDPSAEIQLITMKTTGDIILDRTLDQIGGKGLFVRELDNALLEGRVDLTVHSCKDMPMDTDDRLPVVAVSRRADPRDALILPKGIDTLDLHRPIGCSSARRSLQLKLLYPGCTVESIRGNVLTRLEKLDRQEYAAITLACAGLERLGLGERISRVFTTSELLPAACQGILAVQARAGFDPRCLSLFHDPDALDISIAERSFVKALDGGCSQPVAAYGELAGDTLTLSGFYADSTDRIYRGTITGDRKKGQLLGQELVRRLV